MPLDWEKVKEKYAEGASIPTVAGGRTLEVVGADEGCIHIRTRLWEDEIAREDLEKAVALIEGGKLTRDVGEFADQYHMMVTPKRGTFVSHVLKDLGHL